MPDKKYTIVKKIDAGGMAEVWQGRASSLKGFEKLVAIKRVLPSLSKNKKFISMFLDEARLSLYLNHANVVQTFDIGMAGGAYFIVMEWVDGANLKALLHTAQQLGFRIPREQAVYVAIEICKGLSHAHNRKDPKGRPLSIVHRDVSPPNVLVSREGEVKLVDFGLAKAASQITSTDPGIVKGKFSYLSPEAAHGQPVDGRADIFSAGIVLWEMLAGRKLFDGPTDLKTVELVRRAEIPDLRQFNADVEDSLQQIVNRALAREPRERHQTAEELGHALTRWLFQNRMMVTSYDIATLVKRVLSYAGAAPEGSRPISVENTVQEAIGKFTSLEDIEELEKMSFKSVLEHPGGDDSGLVGVGVDPREWMSELSTDAESTLLDGEGSYDGSIDDTMVADPADFNFDEPARPVVEAIRSAPPQAVPAPSAPPQPVQIISPDAPQPKPERVTGQITRPPQKGFPLAAGVVLGIIGIGALGAAIWLLAS